MICSRKKYSILVPTRNAIQYLPSCIASVLSQDYADFELIVSDNHSSDGTWQYLASLQDSRLKVVRPDKCLAMVDHWEWLLSLSAGRWIVIVGTDDGLMPYFFELADHLTALAEKKGIRAVNSSRAYFFWKGCETAYGEVMVDFRAKPSIAIKRTCLQPIATFVRQKTYLDLPQMYANSIFRSDLVEQARTMQKGCFFSSIIPDANGAAIVCSLEKRYMDCHIPLGWTGSSPKSNGYSNYTSYVNQATQNNAERCTAEDFHKLNAQSQIVWDNRAGNQKLHSFTLFFWESMLRSHSLQSSRFQKLVSSKFIKTLIFASVLSEIRSSKLNQSFRLEMFGELLDYNRCRPASIRAAAFFLPIMRKIVKVIDKLCTRWIVRSDRKAVMEIKQPADAYFDIGKASSLIDDLVREKQIIEAISACRDRIKS